MLCHCVGGRAYFGDGTLVWVSNWEVRCKFGKKSDTGLQISPTDLGIHVNGWEGWRMWCGGALKCLGLCGVMLMSR